MPSPIQLLAPGLLWGNREEYSYELKNGLMEVVTTNHYTHSAIVRYGSIAAVVGLAVMAERNIGKTTTVVKEVTEYFCPALIGKTQETPIRRALRIAGGAVLSFAMLRNRCARPGLKSLIGGVMGDTAAYHYVPMRRRNVTVKVDADSWFDLFLYFASVMWVASIPACIYATRDEPPTADAILDYQACELYAIKANAYLSPNVVDEEYHLPVVYATGTRQEKGLVEDGGAVLAAHIVTPENGIAIDRPIDKQAEVGTVAVRRYVIPGRLCRFLVTNMRMTTVALRDDLVNRAAAFRIMSEICKAIEGPTALERSEAPMEALNWIWHPSFAQIEDHIRDKRRPPIRITADGAGDEAWRPSPPKTQ